VISVGQSLLSAPGRAVEALFGKKASYRPLCQVATATAYMKAFAQRAAPDVCAWTLSLLPQRRRPGTLRRAYSRGLRCYCLVLTARGRRSAQVHARHARSRQRRGQLKTGGGCAGPDLHSSCRQNVVRVESCALNIARASLRYRRSPGSECHWLTGVTHRQGGSAGDGNRPECDERSAFTGRWA
jgi:hypothetical protein